jgi:S-adenosylmethionine/arginine decarboxylase-like enzyme
MRNLNNVSNTMICHIRDILNVNTLHTIERIDQIVNVISIHNRLTIINKMAIVHEERSLEYSLLYVLDDCHISIKTFPETNSLTFHLYFFKNYDHTDCCLINDFLLEAFDADRSISTVDFDDITV